KTGSWIPSTSERFAPRPSVIPGSCSVRESVSRISFSTRCATSFCWSSYASSYFVRPRRRTSRRLSGIRALQRSDVELLHLQESLHDPSGLVGIRVLDQLGEDGRHDLPRHAELVLEPAALLRVLVAAGAELLPVLVDLRLRVAVHLEGDGFVELEERTAVERGERLAVELERD